MEVYIVDIVDRDFKIGLLKEFWNRRSQYLVPATSPGIGLKKQKFLIFYNLIAKTLGEPHTIKNIKAFEQGPVYYDIYSCIKKTNKFLEREQIDRPNFSEDILNATLMLVESESPDSLSKITHAFDLWKSNYDENYNEEIIKEDFQYDSNNINEEDITDMDEKTIEILYEYYLDLYNNYQLFINNKKIYAVEKKNIDIINQVIGSKNPYIEEALDEISKIDTVAKITYDINYKEYEMGGIIFDI